MTFLGSLLRLILLDRFVLPGGAEVGPGTGTFADSMLDFYKNYDLDMYRNCEYIFVEISPYLAQKCEETMRENHK